jgi:hypothetical protein
VNAQRGPAATQATDSLFPISPGLIGRDQKMIGRFLSD